MKQNQVNGLQLLGVGLTAAGLLGMANGVGSNITSIPLIIVAILMCYLGTKEIYFPSKK
jgi:hypothetical protein